MAVIMVSLCFMLTQFCQQVAGGGIELPSDKLGGAAYHRFHAKKDTDDVSHIDYYYYY